MHNPDEIWGDLVRYKVFDLGEIKNATLDQFKDAIVKDDRNAVTQGTLKNLQRSRGYKELINSNNLEYLSEVRSKIKKAIIVEDLDSIEIDEMYEKKTISELRRVYSLRKGTIEREEIFVDYRSIPMKFRNQYRDRTTEETIRLYKEQTGEV